MRVKPGIARWHEPPEGPKSVVDRDHHNLLARGQHAAINEGTVADGIPATVDPHHDRKRTRPSFVGAEFRRVDVDVQAVLGTLLTARSADTPEL